MSDYGKSNEREGDWTSPSDPGAESGDVHLQNELEGIFPQWPSAKEEGRNLPISKGYISNHRIENELVLLFIAR